MLSTYGETLNLLFPTAVALPAAVIGLLFLIVVGERLLGSQPQLKDGAEGSETLYRAEYLIRAGSRLIGRTLSQAGLAEPAGAALLGVLRSDGSSAQLADGDPLAAGDVLAYEATVSTVATLWTTMGLAAAHPPVATGDENAARLGEGVVGNDNDMIGRRVADIDIGNRKLVALSRSRAALPVGIADTVIAAGDIVVLQAPEEDVRTGGPALSLTRELPGYRIKRTDRALAATLIVGAMIALNALGVMSLLIAALLASAALIATGCLAFRAAFKAIDWQTYVILACAVALEPAMTSSGLADVLADRFAGLAGSSVPLALAVVFLGTVVLTNLVTNSAAAVLMFPIAVGIAGSMHGPWQPFVVVLMLGASYAFINPAGYQTHLMVMKPGGYSFGDFAKVGGLLTALLAAVVIPLATILYVR